METKRIPWLDLAKGYGMILVFYGHFVERLMVLQNTAALLQFKFIYSFHLPLFFILTGYVYRQKESSFQEFLKARLVSRLIPVLFFNLLGLFVGISEDLLLGSVHLKSYLFGLASYARGYPVHNFVTWFLICLFIIEIIHFFLSSYLTTPRALMISAACFLVVGWLVTWKIGFVTATTGIVKNFWFVHEALIAYAFFQFGIILKNWGRLEAKRPLVLQVGLLLLCLAFVLTTFQLNTGPFTVEIPAVIMADSSHGNLILFSLTAMAGSLLVIFLAQLTTSFKPVLFIGQNTIVLLGLNGFFFHFINKRVASEINAFVADSFWPVFVVSSLATLISMMLCVPWVYLFNKFFPQLIGRPQRHSYLSRKFTALVKARGEIS